MPLTIKCPSCQHENPADAVFCQHCGRSLVSRCSRCNAENALDAVFCRQCGIKLSEATIGVNPDRATEWARQFTNFGYDSTDPSWRDFLNHELGAANAPTLGADKEIMVFFLPIGISNWWAEWVRVTDPRDEQYLWRVPRGLLIASNWRLLIGCRLKYRDKYKGGRTWGCWPYHGLKTMTMAKDRISLKMADGENVEIQLKIPRPGLFDLGALLFGSPVTQATAMVKSRDMAGAANTVTDAFYGFFAEVVRTVDERRKQT